MRDVHARPARVDGSGRHDRRRRCGRQPARRLRRAHRRPRRGCSSARISTPCRTPARSTACSAWCWASRSSNLLGGRRLPFAIEVVGFSEEEGVRFGVPFIGSRALAGTLDEALLARTDAAGRTVARGDSRLRARPARASSEAQRRGRRARLPRVPHRAGTGARPLGLPLGVVDAIAGQSRLDADLHRRAPTTPARRRWRRAAMRSPAPRSGSRAVESAARRPRPVWSRRSAASRSTPGAANVDRRARCVASLDVRHADDAARARGRRRLCRSRRRDRRATRARAGLTSTRSRPAATPMDAAAHRRCSTRAVASGAARSCTA